VARPTIYEVAGGESAWLALAAAHHQRCLDDDVLNHPFSHGTRPDHIERLAAYWAEVFGGPPTYSQGCGGQPAMLGLHANTDAEAAMGERFLACFLAAIDDADLPDDPDLRAALRAYMEWATADVMSYAPRSAVVPDRAAVPRWSWDGPVA
jgi:hemoglobin